MASIDNGTPFSCAEHPRDIAIAYMEARNQSDNTGRLFETKRISKQTNEDDLLTDRVVEWLDSSIETPLGPTTPRELFAYQHCASKRKSPISVLVVIGSGAHYLARDLHLQRLTPLIPKEILPWIKNNLFKNPNDFDIQAIGPENQPWEHVEASANDCLTHLWTKRSKLKLAKEQHLELDKKTINNIKKQLPVGSYKPVPKIRKINLRIGQLDTTIGANLKPDEWFENGKFRIAIDPNTLHQKKPKVWMLNDPRSNLQSAIDFSLKISRAVHPGRVDFHGAIIYHSQSIRDYGSKSPDLYPTLQTTFFNKYPLNPSWSKTVSLQIADCTVKHHRGDDIAKIALLISMENAFLSEDPHPTSKVLKAIWESTSVEKDLISHLRREENIPYPVIAQTIAAAGLLVISLPAKKNSCIETHQYDVTLTSQNNVPTLAVNYRNSILSIPLHPLTCAQTLQEDIPRLSRNAKIELTKLFFIWMVPDNFQRITSPIIAQYKVIKPDERKQLFSFAKNFVNSNDECLLMAGTAILCALSSLEYSSAQHLLVFDLLPKLFQHADERFRDLGKLITHQYLLFFDLDKQSDLPAQYSDRSIWHKLIHATGYPRLVAKVETVWKQQELREKLKALRKLISAGNTKKAAEKLFEVHKLLPNGNLLRKIANRIFNLCIRVATNNSFDGFQVGYKLLTQPGISNILRKNVKRKFAQLCLNPISHLPHLPSISTYTTLAYALKSSSKATNEEIQFFTRLLSTKKISFKNGLRKQLSKLAPRLLYEQLAHGTHKTRRKLLKGILYHKLTLQLSPKATIYLQRYIPSLLQNQKFIEGLDYQVQNRKFCLSTDTLEAIFPTIFNTFWSAENYTSAIFWVRYYLSSSQKHSHIHMLWETFSTEITSLVDEVIPTASEICQQLYNNGIPVDLDVVQKLAEHSSTPPNTEQALVEILVSHLVSSQIDYKPSQRHQNLILEQLGNTNDSNFIEGVICLQNNNQLPNPETIPAVLTIQRYHLVKKQFKEASKWQKQIAKLLGSHVVVDDGIGKQLLNIYPHLENEAQQTEWLHLILPHVSPTIASNIYQRATELSKIYLPSDPITAAEKLIKFHRKDKPSSIITDQLALLIPHLCQIDKKSALTTLASMLKINCKISNFNCWLSIWKNVCTNGSVELADTFYSFWKVVKKPQDDTNVKLNDAWVFIALDTHDSSSTKECVTSVDSLTEIFITLEENKLVYKATFSLLRYAVKDENVSDDTLIKLRGVFNSQKATNIVKISADIVLLDKGIENKNNKLILFTLDSILSFRTSKLPDSIIIKIDHYFIRLFNNIKSWPHNGSEVQKYLTCAEFVSDSNIMQANKIISCFLWLLSIEDIALNTPERILRRDILVAKLLYNIIKNPQRTGWSQFGKKYEKHLKPGQLSLLHSIFERLSTHENMSKTLGHCLLNEEIKKIINSKKISILWGNILYTCLKNTQKPESTHEARLDALKVFASNYDECYYSIEHEDKCARLALKILCQLLAKDHDIEKFQYYFNIFFFYTLVDPFYPSSNSKDLPPIALDQETFSKNCTAMLDELLALELIDKRLNSELINHCRAILIPKLNQLSKKDSDINEFTVLKKQIEKLLFHSSQLYAEQIYFELLTSLIEHKGLETVFKDDPEKLKILKLYFNRGRKPPTEPQEVYIELLKKTMEYTYENHPRVFCIAMQPFHYARILHNIFTPETETNFIHWLYNFATDESRKDKIDASTINNIREILISTKFLFGRNFKDEALIIAQELYQKIFISLFEELASLLQKWPENSYDQLKNVCISLKILLKFKIFTQQSEAFQTIKNKLVEFYKKITPNLTEQQLSDTSAAISKL